MVPAVYGVENGDDAPYKPDCDAKSEATGFCCHPQLIRMRLT
jgi:hypothetical protein